MKRNLMLALFAAAMVAAAFHCATKAWATPASGFTGLTIAKGTLAQFEVFNHAVLPSLNEEDRKVWLSLQKTRGDSDLYIQSNTWIAAQSGQPIPNTGWHSHPGHSLIIVTAGTLTDYEADDPSCTPHVYTVGNGIRRFRWPTRTHHPERGQRGRAEHRCPTHSGRPDPPH